VCAAGREGHLLEAAALLAHAGESSPYNHHIKLPLICIYRHLGMYGADRPAGLGAR
jgi:hypothetical protein